MCKISKNPPIIAECSGKNDTTNQCYGKKTGIQKHCHILMKKWLRNLLCGKYNWFSLSLFPILRLLDFYTNKNPYIAFCIDQDLRFGQTNFGQLGDWFAKTIYLFTHAIKKGTEI